ncbi:hypothetical protein C1645_837468 [Glomus cerebriforme]|uniref:Uncharacterized protein n=1 Tax=Glomus cerebriforme TaxID=658196 RepID=A0A397S5Y5_9GLOM|nr:hypothetical protein C1645_839254 [Glomus cerebriforme]RIA81144.1 hypothetical protein C1645_837468 [Glomus cerebriforme]
MSVNQTKIKAAQEKAYINGTRPLNSGEKAIFDGLDEAVVAIIESNLDSILKVKDAAIAYIALNKDSNLAKEVIKKLEDQGSVNDAITWAKGHFPSDQSGVFDHADVKKSTEEVDTTLTKLKTDVPGDTPPPGNNKEIEDKLNSVRADIRKKQEKEQKLKKLESALNVLKGDPDGVHTTNIIINEFQGNNVVDNITDPLPHARSSETLVSAIAHAKGKGYVKTLREIGKDKLTKVINASNYSGNKNDLIKKLPKTLEFARYEEALYGKDFDEQRR